jgi:glutaconate CoA-transferase subunit A
MSDLRPETKVVSSARALAGKLREGTTLGIGGFGLDRKPMALVAAVAASGVGGLTVETYAGGFDIEVLLAAGILARVSASHVGLDQFGLAPLFRSAREAGRIAFQEWSELSQLHAWRAAADGVPFAAIRMDPRSELLNINPSLSLRPSPIDGSPTVIAEAPRIDLAILHAEAAHPQGWAIAGGDAYLDTLLARAAGTVIVSAERLMDDAELERRHRDVHLVAGNVDAVVLAPDGARPGSCLPAYMIDFPACRAYCERSAAGVAPVDLVAGMLAGMASWSAALPAEGGA